MKSFIEFVESIDDDLKTKGSEAFGGRPAKQGELRSVYHSTGATQAHKILQHGFKTSHQINPHFGKDVYGKGGGQHYVYTSLSHKASLDNAVGTDVTFHINAEPHRNKAIIQHDKEGGLVMHHGGLPNHSIKNIIVNKRTPETDKLIEKWKRIKASKTF